MRKTRKPAYRGKRRASALKIKLRRTGGKVKRLGEPERKTWSGYPLSGACGREAIANAESLSGFGSLGSHQEGKMIFRDLSATVGGTPVVELARVAKDRAGRVIGKLEMRNPCGSVKDRVGIALIEDAEEKGILRAGTTLVEATGGNTGIALACVAATRGYRLILTMPQTMSRERVALLRHLGAEVVLTPGILMTDAVARADEIVKEIPSAIMLDQFRNRANPEIHRRTTAVEIWEDTAGVVDVFVCAVGTGGTITGVGEVLKERKPNVRRRSCGARERRTAFRRPCAESPDSRDRRWVYSGGLESFNLR
jgi:hypothetical protein